MDLKDKIYINDTHTHTHTHPHRHTNVRKFKRQY